MRLTPLLLALAVNAAVIPQDAYCIDDDGAAVPCTPEDVGKVLGAPYPPAGFPNREHLAPAALANNLHLNNNQRRSMAPVKVPAHAPDSFLDSIEGRAYTLMQKMEKMNHEHDLKQKEAMKKEIQEMAKEIEDKKKEFVKLARIIESKKILSDQFLNPEQD